MFCISIVENNSFQRNVLNYKSGLYVTFQKKKKKNVSDKVARYHFPFSNLITV